MSFEIVYLQDEHDCETCGTAYASGYQIYYDGDLMVDKTPVASCLGGDEYYNDNPYKDIVDLLKEHVTETQGDIEDE